MDSIPCAACLRPDSGYGIHGCPSCGAPCTLDLGDLIKLQDVIVTCLEPSCGELYLMPQNHLAGPLRVDPRDGSYY